MQRYVALCSGYGTEQTCFARLSQGCAPNFAAITFRFDQAQRRPDESERERETRIEFSASGRRIASHCKYCRKLEIHTAGSRARARLAIDLVGWRSHWQVSKTGAPRSECRCLAGVRHCTADCERSLTTVRPSKRAPIATDASRLFIATARRLAQRIAERRISHAERARLIRSICDALVLALRAPMPSAMIGNRASIKTV